jgi:short-subunit dehydrogenase
VITNATSTALVVGATKGIGAEIATLQETDASRTALTRMSGSREMPFTATP